MVVSSLGASGPGGNGGYGPEGLSNFVWCLEIRVNEAAHNQNFHGIDAPSAVRESATEPSNWNAGDIRSTWLKNVGS